VVRQVYKRRTLSVGVAFHHQTPEVGEENEGNPYSPTGWVSGKQHATEKAKHADVHLRKISERSVALPVRLACLLASSGVTITQMLKHVGYSSDISSAAAVLEENTSALRAGALGERHVVGTEQDRF
jgi:hypothetical protein